jgi:hypothetical protein
VRELKAQLDAKGLDRYDGVVVLGGRNYAAVVRAVFAGKQVYTPLEGCRGIGFMMQKLKQAITRGVPLETS